MKCSSGRVVLFHNVFGPRLNLTVADWEDHLTAACSLTPSQAMRLSASLARWAWKARKPKAKRGAK